MGRSTPSCREGEQIQLLPAATAGILQGWEQLASGETSPKPAVSWLEQPKGAWPKRFHGLCLAKDFFLAPCFELGFSRRELLAACWVLSAQSWIGGNPSSILSFKTSPMAARSSLRTPPGGHPEVSPGTSPSLSPYGKRPVGLCWGSGC